jgi:hypothetical protein
MSLIDSQAERYHCSYSSTTSKVFKLILQDGYQPEISAGSDAVKVVTLDHLCRNTYREVHQPMRNHNHETPVEDEANRAEE